MEHLRYMMRKKTAENVFKHNLSYVDLSEDVIKQSYTYFYTRIVE